MQFEWHERKAAVNAAKHGVAFDEAATVFGDMLSWTYADPAHSESERRWLTIGRSEAGRILVIAHTEESPQTVRIISARRATRKERRFYEDG